MDILKAVKNNIAQIIVGNDAAIELVMIALVANGHILLEDVPGTGKTSLAKSLARSIDGKFQRLQFTSDTLPGDVILAFMRAAQSRALLNGRSYCTPEDFRFLAKPVCSHRLTLTIEGEMKTTKTQVIQEILETVSAPVESV
ncbi:TPA: AAA family ATPase [Bacillus cereus]|jgi:MoxR-like ATPase|uniref:Magnesium chelatase n=3 Tax=Bacillus cereus group TaxID=86661 RepID=A0A150B081_BACCE|nr:MULTISPECIES: MoxR family ATPase [Bacillus]HDR4496385.1 MoxR family ATPase [Bacillus cereus biovar anthracis]ADK05750.1 MoxR-like ATPase [Bacillus cereus biovar anthracis str. CI]AUD21379.1 MoxR family ATPase [Bacillus sp. HBCD-sjtu]AXO99165.1 MoxR family ATPase [Bacillus anthracis]KAA2391721.1 MoxR family ATPase [Bacillus cereus]